jgi:methyl-accepting chemotaxis protein
MTTTTLPVAKNGSGDLPERTEFFGISGDEAHYSAIRRTLGRVGPAALERLYQQIAKTPHLAAMFRSGKHMSDAKNAQMSHWDYLFSGAVSPQYAARAKQVGLVHARIGLEPRWYIGGYSRVLAEMIEHMVTSSFLGRFGIARRLAGTLQAMIRASLLDMELALSAYFDAMNVSREEAIKRFGEAMNELAHGNLTVTLNNVPAEYAALADSFSLMVARLRADLETVALGADHINSGASEIQVASEKPPQR